MMTPQEYEIWYQSQQQQPQSAPRGNGGLRVLACLTGIAVCGFFTIIALKMDVLPQTHALPTPVPAISAPVVRQPASSNVQPTAPVITALPIQAQVPVKEQPQVEQAPVQDNVLPTAQVVQATAIPANVQVHYDGTDRRFVPTATAQPAPTATPEPAPQYSVTTNESGQQCIDVPSASNGFCMLDDTKMDKATQEWVASMMAAGHIHPPTEEAQK
jgi:hypothetical protein